MSIMFYRCDLKKKKKAEGEYVTSRWWSDLDSRCLYTKYSSFTKLDMRPNLISLNSTDACLNKAPSTGLLACYRLQVKKYHLQHRLNIVTEQLPPEHQLNLSVISKFAALN